MAGRLTTHVIDTAQGLPAAHMVLELWRLESSSGRRLFLKTTCTNAGGRTETPLLEEDNLTIGCYEIVFMVGDYFAGHAVTTTMPPFLSQIPIRFNIADPAGHYHVPLLVSPWAYSTYRGS